MEKIALGLGKPSLSGYLHITHVYVWKRSLVHCRGYQGAGMIVRLYKNSFARRSCPN